MIEWYEVKVETSFFGALLTGNYNEKPFLAASCQHCEKRLSEFANLETFGKLI